VPGLNGFKGIEPGETFTYRFTARQSGTYWYHAHSGTQEQAGIYAPIIIDPATPDPVRTQQDYVVLLSDYTDTDGYEILRNLRTTTSTTIGDVEQPPPSLRTGASTAFPTR